MQLRSINSYPPLFKPLLGIPTFRNSWTCLLCLFGWAVESVVTQSSRQVHTSVGSPLVFVRPFSACIGPLSWGGGEGIQNPCLLLPGQVLWPLTAMHLLVALCMTAQSPARPPQTRRVQVCLVRAACRSQMPGASSQSSNACTVRAGSASSGDARTSGQRGFVRISA